MATVATWPWLVGGPGDGEPLPREGGKGPFLYRDPDDDLVTYREVKLIVVPDALAVRLFIYAIPGYDPILAGYQAMARRGVEAEGLR
jgi:hypothetical protein